MFDSDAERALLAEMQQRLRKAVQRFDKLAPGDLIALLYCAAKLINSLADISAEAKERDT